MGNVCPAPTAFRDGNGGQRVAAGRRLTQATRARRCWRWALGSAGSPRRRCQLVGQSTVPGAEFAQQLLVPCPATSASTLLEEGHVEKQNAQRRCEERRKPGRHDASIVTQPASGRRAIQAVPQRLSNARRSAWPSGGET